VHFKKAFDIVPHEVLWQVLVGLKVEGRFLQCLKAMYAKVPYASTTQTKVSPLASNANKV
jgi:hypothetical protein